MLDHDAEYQVVKDQQIRAFVDETGLISIIPALYERTVENRFLKRRRRLHFAGFGGSPSRRCLARGE